MFGKGKAERPKRNRSNNLSQFGLFNVGMDVEINEDNDGDDGDLEAELLALTGGGAKPKPNRKAKVVPDADLDAMVAASMRDVPSDAELSGDEDDPDLLNELSAIAGDDMEPEPEPEKPSPKASPTDMSKLLQERLKMYETAEKNAKDAGETSRARRFGRGIKNLKDLIKQVNAGRAIKEEDIPPVVTVNTQKHQEEPSSTSETLSPTRPAPSVPTPSEEKSPEEEKPSVAPSAETVELLNMLNARKKEYKIAAVQAKRAGDAQTALNFVKTVKQFDTVIQAVENNEKVDLSNIPGPPVLLEPASTPQPPSVEQSETQSAVEVPTIDIPEPTEPLPEPTLITASSIEEALLQRLEVFQKQEAKAKEEGNSGKVRRMGRIIKQFETALKLHRAGKPFPIEDLPNPPGYAPIAPEGPSASAPKEELPQPPPKPAAAPKPSPTPSVPAPSPPGKSNNALHRIEKQVAMLKAKQMEFKEAALAAKKKGEMAQAKEFLRSAKGFDRLIDAAQGGLPIDLSSLPVSPSVRSQLDDEYDVVMADEASEVDPEHLDILSRLEQQLTKQLKLCLTTRDHNKAIGDVASMNRFEQLALAVTRDLDVIRLAKRASHKVPKFHYETRNFSIVKSFTDLNDSDLELTVVRGVNYNCKDSKDIDTYVKFEFPYPQDEPVKNKTAVVRDTNNPEYNETFTLPIERTQRQCQRVFKRHGIKFEVYSKGWCASDWAYCCSGFFRGDTLLGTVTVKLQPLETQCELHDSFELMEGRKKIGGKLEVKLRVRDPMVTRQVEQLSEKWLVLD